VLEARSLLWALDPLAATPEGGVVVTVAQDSDRERLQAQLQVLDALRQPRLLVVPPDTPTALAGPLAAADLAQFDWVVARQPWQGQSPEQIDAWIRAAGSLLEATGQWRLLFSTPQLGPAAGLLALVGTADSLLEALLQELADLERQQLSPEHHSAQIAQRSLIAQGWQVQPQQWQESLQLELSDQLIERWLGPNSAYLNQLASLRGRPLAAETVAILREGFTRQRGQPLPQALEHTLLVAHTPRPTKKPRQRRGS
jgi:putative ATPase